MVVVGFMEVELTPIERRVYEIICDSDEVMCKQIPPKLAGAIPGLVGKGLVEVYKKRALGSRHKRLKFVRAV